MESVRNSVLNREEPLQTRFEPEKTIERLHSFRQSVCRQDVKDDKGNEILVETGTVTRPNIETGRTNTFFSSNKADTIKTVWENQNRKEMNATVVNPDKKRRQITNEVD